MDERMERRSKRKHLINSSSYIPVESQHMHLPKLSQRESRVKRHSQSLASYRLIDYSMEKVKYKAAPLLYLSSKIDFFNAENQRKLDVSKRKILSEVGAIPTGPKQRPLYVRRKHNLGPQLHILVQKYLRKKQEKEQRDGSFIVVGPENLLYL